uniref:HMG box domain-containing protein n=1 Tax=Globodera pallida TaxID=36090 RepID=A0A183BM71_GLOPA
MLYVYHNGNQLEMFFVHPLVFSHDLVRKDQRLLFCVKNQCDGTVSMKFRVRFCTFESVNNFCATIGKYIGVKAFEDWSRRSASPFSVDLANTSIGSANRSSVVDPDMSTSSVSLLNCFSQCSKLSSQDAPPFDISRAQMMDQRPKCVDTSTQTVTDENIDPKQNLGALPSSSSSVHLHIENLFTTEAVHEIGNVLRQMVNSDNNKKIETRGRKKKNAIEMKPPKRPLSSYFLWTAETRKRSSTEWKAMPQEEKEHWKLRAAVERVRYQDQIKAYKKEQQRQ